VPQPGHEDEVLPPGEDLVDGGELAGAADRGPVATSKPSTVAVPASARSSVDRMFTTVVLPAPFEPSSAKMLPRATSKSTPHSTCSSSYDFVRPCTRSAGASSVGVLIGTSPGSRPAQPRRGRWRS